MAKTETRVQEKGGAKKKVKIAGSLPVPLKSSPTSAKEQPKQVFDLKGKQKAKASERRGASLPSTFVVVAGSYEKLLYGLEGHVTFEKDRLKFDLEPIFIFPAHVSCIKAVAASPDGGKWLATGSADEIVKVWDLRRRKEIGGLMQHEGSITHLNFLSRSHLLSASEDGTLCLFHARDWTVLRSLRGHKGRVNSFAAHPSNKIALSVGKDRTLRMWDLMRGKGCASTKLGKEGEVVRWSVGGDLFVVQSGQDMDIYNTEMVLLHTITHPSRLHDGQFCKVSGREQELLLVAAEDKKVSIYEIRPGSKEPPKVIGELIGHENRIKQIQTTDIALPSTIDGPSSTTIVATASSDGKIHIYDLSDLALTSQADARKIAPVAVYDTKGTRLTCLTLADGEVSRLSTGKRKREDGDASAGSDVENELEKMGPCDEDSE